MASNPDLRLRGRTHRIGEMSGAGPPIANEAIGILPDLTTLTLETGPDAMICLNRAGIICAVNSRATSLFGYHPKMMTGADIGAFLSLEPTPDAPPPESGARGLLQLLLSTGEQAVEAIAHTASADLLTVEVTRTTYRHELRDYVICAARDISHRKHHEVILAEAKEIAERANIAKLEFLSQLSHELRTPLAAVIGFGEVMRDEMFGPLGVKLYRSYAADICQSGRQLADVVERIIDIARLEGHIATAHARAADLGEIVERVIEKASGEASKLNIRLGNNIRRGSMPVVLDDESLEKMIGHMVDNAIAYNHFGGKVEISAVADQSKDSNLISLSITDTGPGMLPAKLAELKSTLDGSRRDGGGGLELCAAFLHLIGGNLDICSAPNLGTTVTLAFPRRSDGHWRP